tara:strand:- start:577 stop:810 length:234 start_codon:yes stop_codon:yes gene_type:complete
MNIEKIQNKITEEIALLKSWGLPDKHIKDALLKTNYVKGIRLLTNNHLNTLIQISLKQIKENNMKQNNEDKYDNTNM